LQSYFEQIENQKIPRDSSRNYRRGVGIAGLIVSTARN
jgi:hypothetical protein